MIQLKFMIIIHILEVINKLHYTLYAVIFSVNIGFENINSEKYVAKHTDNY